MLCKRPYSIGKHLVGCGQCLPCRINRRRGWVTRLMLESMMHDYSCFVTLTYSDDHLPVGGTLVISDYQNFLKRLRKSISPLKIRYFFVGEYGDKSERPHYHAIIFGLGPADAQLIQDHWPLGYTMTGDFTEQSAQYVCGYVLKKMTSPDDSRLCGRHPEFARMSLRPGIGAKAMAIVADAYFTKQGVEEVMLMGDVTHNLKFGRKSVPLVRYLRRVLRDEIGMPDEFWKETYEIYAQAEKERLLAMQQAAEAAGEEDVSITSLEVKSNVQRLLNLEARYKLYDKEKKL